MHSLSNLDYDIVVVGAGPAGATAAREAAKAGVRVLLLEKKSRIGVPVQCAEFVPRVINDYCELDRHVVAQSIAEMLTFLPDDSCFRIPAPGYIVNRTLFDQRLAADARDAGADILVKAEAVRQTDRGLLINYWGKEVEVGAKVIIGCDGPLSTVGKWIGQENKEFVVSLQGEVVLHEEVKETRVYFDYPYKDGYGWVFPKGKTANVGVGIKLPEGRAAKGQAQEGNLLRQALAHLFSKTKVKESDVISYTGGLIPVGGGLSRTVSGNCLLAGDAAGHTHPVTGAGIFNAVLCGYLAGQTAAEAVKAGDLSRLSEYESLWREYLEGSLTRAVANRRFFEKRWTSDQAELTKVIKASWVAFPDYGRDKKIN